MLQFIYRWMGIMLLGLLGFLGIFFFEILVPLLICFAIGALVYQLIAGEEPSFGSSFKPMRAVEALGKWTIWLLLSPVLLPLWLFWQSGRVLLWIIRKWQQSRAEKAQRKTYAEAEASRRVTAARDAEQRRRRNDLLFSCEIFYSAHAQELAGRFSKAQLDDFIARYLHDQLPLDVLQERVNQLMRLLRQQLEAVEPPSSKASLRQLAEWYARQKREIDELPVEKTFREDYLLQLNERYAQLCQQALEEVNP